MGAGPAGEGAVSYLLNCKYFQKGSKGLMRPVPQTANRMNRMTIAVTGATGKLGRLVIAGLKAKRPAR